MFAMTVITMWYHYYPYNDYIGALVKSKNTYTKYSYIIACSAESMAIEVH